MKKVFKWGWIFLVVGVICLVLGGFARGAKDVVFNNWRPVVYSAKANFQKNYAVGEFKQVDSNVGNANVVIRRGDDYRVRYVGQKSARPSVKVLNDRVTVRQKASGSQRASVGFRWHDRSQKVRNKVIIEVPDNVKLEQVRNLNNNGSTKIIGLSTANLEALGSHGALVLNNMNIDKANVELRDGEEIRLNNTILLGGLITSDDNDVLVENGTLRNVEIQQNDADLAMHNVALDCGKIDMSDGDVKIAQSTVTNGYTVNNDDGDNIIDGVKAGGYVSTTGESSDNNLFSNHADGGTLRSGLTRNVLNIKNNTGDNVIR